MLSTVVGTLFYLRMLSGNDMFRLSTRMKKAEEIASELIVKEIEDT